MRPSSMVTSSQRLVTPLPVGTAVVEGTLRARLEEVRAQGGTLNLRQSVGIIVPLCVQIAELHRNGLKLFVHPSSLTEDQYGFYKVSLELAHRPPILPRDKACLAPEERGGEPGSARASVFAVGAILYELVTGLSVGPGMRRPSEVIASLPQAFEAVLAKALGADSAHRPDDLNALAQALHQFAPPGTIPPPPPADVSRLDHDSNFEVDVRMSMLPPEDLPIELRMSAVPKVPPGRSQPQQQPPPRAMDATSELASLKARLESDPRPRYVVVKEGMDHGPFSAVELLQQIASHTFVEGDVLRDSLSADERPIKDWEEFAPFAEHAKLHRDIKAEKVAIERVVAQEGRSTRGKAFFGIIIVGAILAAGVVWFLTVRGSRKDEVAVMDDTLSNIEVDGGLAGSGKRGAGGKRIVGK